MAFLLFSACAFAQSTTTVSGNLKNLGTGTVSSNTFVRFYLRGCSGNQPRINGTALIAPTLGNVYYFDFVPNGSGTISGTLYSTRDAAGTGNGAIECGGSFTAVWYGMTTFLNGRAGPEVPVHAKASATLDISNVTPITSNPVVTAPTGDSTYARIDAGNQPFTGAITSPGITDTGTLSVTSTATLNGATTVNAAETVNGVLTAQSAGNLQQVISKASSDANQGYSAQNSVQNWACGVRQDNSEAYICRDVTSSNDRLKIPTGTGLMTVPNLTGTFARTSGDTFTTTTLTSPTITSPTINTGITNSGTGLMHMRVASCTTAASANAACNVTINWPGTWANTSYTASCTLDSPSGGNVWVVATQTKSTTQITVIIQNVPGNSAASNGTLNCIGVHD